MLVLSAFHSQSSFLRFQGVIDLLDAFQFLLRAIEIAFEQLDIRLTLQLLRCLCCHSLRQQLDLRLQTRIVALQFVDLNAQETVEISILARSPEKPL